MRSIDTMMAEGRRYRPSGGINEIAEKYGAKVGPGRKGLNTAWDVTIDGIKFLHITDDGPDVPPDERFWCEYEGHPLGGVQAHMAPTWTALVEAVKAEIAKERPR